MYVLTSCHRYLFLLKAKIYFLLKPSHSILPQVRLLLDALYASVMVRGAILKGDCDVVCGLTAEDEEEKEIEMCRQ